MRGKTKFIYLVLSVSLVLLLVGQASAAFLDIGPHQDSFSGWTRGYFFEAPADFTITGLRVPTDMSSEPQYIQVIRFNSAPPVFSSTTNDFASLGYWANVPGNNFISTNIAFQAGDLVGILGSRGTADVNSYGAAEYVTSLGGYSITLTRMGFQDGLSNGPAYDVWTEPSYSIGRIEMEYTMGGAVPLPATLLLFGPALAALSLLRRRLAR